MRKFTLTLLVFLVCSSSYSQFAKYYASLKWRSIGPYRGGRTVGGVGVPSEPNVFYIGANNGGVWKTTDYGRTWNPIFDDQPTGSIGDIVVSPSNPKVIYVGSGEGIQRPDLSVGDGVYKSVDAGKTWTHLGLSNILQIGGLAIHPTNENIVYVAGLGHPYGPNKERGIFKTTDGGKTWEHVLYIDENTGAIQVTLDPKNPEIVYADMWAGRQGPWENGAWNGPNSGMFKSFDGGKTWKRLTKGLPTPAEGLGRIGFTISPSDPNRLYATVDAGDNGGVYRSDDAGESWYCLTKDGRFWGRGADFAELKVDPNNRDLVYSANVVTWKSADGGYNWEAFRGAPGGDDYHRIWINPNNSNIMLLVSDQGAIVTVNGGETFSSWYNQSTAQFYHVSTDNSFPYNVMSGQQESGSASVASRGNDGAITFKDWHPVGVEEYGYIAADPLDPNIVYGGKITRFDRRTGQVQNIAPEAIRSGKYRFIRTAPVLFSPVDNKTLYFAGNVLFKTLNGGQNWEVISPDLTRETWDVPASVGIYTSEKLKTMPRRGVIYTVAPSNFDLNTIWVGTDDGLIHLTRNGGKTWTNCTPPEISSWQKVSLMDAGHFDNNTAYAAINAIRCDDLRPHIFRTHDGGKTWKEITNGLPNDPINVVREDPTTKGLLYAGSERAVYVSFDDGEHWESLRLNMPATSVRDLVIKDHDLVVGTHGRGFYILDDITPLRNMASIKPSEPVFFKPSYAYRVRWSMYTDTPYPQEEPAGENPPDGAQLYYYLPSNAKEVKIEIKDSKGSVIRTYSSNDTFYGIQGLNIPDYWIRRQSILSTQQGAHQWVWDLRKQPLNIQASFPIGAVYHNTAPDPTSPLVAPGKYTVVFTADGVSSTGIVEVKPDPRVKTSKADLQLVYQLADSVYQVRKAGLEWASRIQKASSITVTKDMLYGSKEQPGLNSILSRAGSLFGQIDDNDVRPTAICIKESRKLVADYSAWLKQWGSVLNTVK